MNVSDYSAARSTVVAAATGLFTEAELQSSGLATALAAIRVRESDGAAVPAAETALQQHDELAFMTREAAESRGDTSGGQAYLDAFRKARAAFAIKELLVGNYERARYEAHHAISDRT